MFCVNCGNELDAGDRFCAQCGTLASSPPTPRDPVSDTSVSISVPDVPDPADQHQGIAPSDTTQSSANDEKQEALWNPIAACNWSILFTPAFGSYLQAQNWRKLGNIERANSQMAWFYVSIIMPVVYIDIAFSLDSPDARGIARLVAMVFLFGWYFMSGRKQVTYIKTEFGKAYPRRPWFGALAVGVAALVGYYILVVLVGLAYASTSAAG